MGYYQIPIDTKDQHKTALDTLEEHYKFVNMPFSLTNAIGIF